MIHLCAGTLPVTPDLTNTIVHSYTLLINKLNPFTHSVLSLVRISRYSIWNGTKRQCELSVSISKGGYWDIVCKTLSFSNRYHKKTDAMTS